MTDTSDSLPQDAAPAADVRYAGFWIRVGAYLIDGIIGFAVGVGITFLGAPMLYLVLALVLLLYKPFFEGIWGATPGKMLLGLQVRDKALATIGITSAVIRSVFVLAVGLISTLNQYKLKVAGIGAFDFEKQQSFAQENMPLQIAIYVTSILWIVAAVFVAFTARKRGLHDMLADTVVVYKESLPRNQDV